MDWSTKAQAECWGEWRYDLDTLAAAQKEFLGRGRLLVTVERDGASEPYEWRRVLYIAPVPISQHDTTFSDSSLANQRRVFNELDLWLKGYLAGRGLPAPR